MIPAAWAADSGTQPGNNQDCADFESLDKDHNGVISRDEGFADENVAKFWDQLDSSIDSKLDKAEFAQLETVVQRENALKTDHPQAVQQYENGKYISPQEQMERNKREQGQ